MNDLKLQLAQRVRSRLVALRCRPPSLAIIRNLIEVMHLVSLKTEEGRFVRASLTYADPSNPEHSPTLIKRIGSPEFHRFQKESTLTVPICVKLCRAIDGWCGSIAVYAKGSKIFAWGFIDQLVSYNISLNNEGNEGLLNPGLFCISIDNVAELSVYHNTTLLGALRRDKLILKETEALGELSLKQTVLDYLEPAAEKLVSPIARHMSLPIEQREKLNMSMIVDLSLRWEQVAARLCIGVRRAGTGGAFILTPNQRKDILSLSYATKYARLEQAMLLSCLDQEYLSLLQTAFHGRSPRVLRRDVSDIMLAQTDAEGREAELTGAVKIVASFATMDGAVLMTPLWGVLGFGVKIISSVELGKIYVGDAYRRHGRRAKLANISQLGMRHTSMLRYCREDPQAIGIVVSQDGDVRVIATLNDDLLLWENVRVLQRRQHVGWQRRQNLAWRKARAQEGNKTIHGYTSMPKTLSELARYK